MKRDQAIKKLKALKELAERGVGGEKEGAQRAYEKLKEKYSISEEELLEEPQEKRFDGDTMFQAATAATMLKAEQQECDDCPAQFGREECEECGTYANIQRLCLQLETLSRKKKGKGQQE